MSAGLVLGAERAGGFFGFRLGFARSFGFLEGTKPWGYIAGRSSRLSVVGFEPGTSHAPTGSTNSDLGGVGTYGARNTSE